MLTKCGCTKMDPSAIDLKFGGLSAPRTGLGLSGGDHGLLHAAGCAKVYSEKIGGALSDRTELAKLLRRLADGDVLMVTRLDRLARSTRDLLNCQGQGRLGDSFQDLRSGSSNQIAGSSSRRGSRLHPWWRA
jgi:hypothetical protein